MLFFGPGDMPLCTSNTADLGLSPVTLIKLEDFGLKLDERICTDYSGAQGIWNLQDFYIVACQADMGKKPKPALASAS